MQGNAAGPFSGTRATYVALSSVTILLLALLTSIWHSDVSGSVAVLGLLSIYMSSTELLILFLALTPLSVVVDIIRLTVASAAVRGKGWLVFFSVAEMLAKIAGTVFAWSLHRSITTGGEGGQYTPIVAPAAAGVRGNGNGLTSGGNAYSQGMPGGGADADPFAAYAPPRPDQHGSVPPSMQSSYQPFAAPTTHV